MGFACAKQVREHSSPTKKALIIFIGFDRFRVRADFDAFTFDLGFPLFGKARGLSMHSHVIPAFPRNKNKMQVILADVPRAPTHGPACFSRHTGGPR